VKRMIATASCSLENREREMRRIRRIRRMSVVERSLATRRCPLCGSRVTEECGVMRCTVCNWSSSIHDVS